MLGREGTHGDGSSQSGEGVGFGICSPPMQRLKRVGECSVVRGEKRAGDVVIREEVLAERRSCGRGVMSASARGSMVL